MASIVNPKTGLSLKESIIDLYLNVKIRSSEDIANFSSTQFVKEKERLESCDPFLVIEYIKSSIEILMNLKLEDHELDIDSAKNDLDSPTITENSLSDTQNVEPPKDYEAMLQKLEAEIRCHIRVEQQLKLHIESTQYKYEEAEKSKKVLIEKNKAQFEELGKDLKKLKEHLSKKDKENESKTKEIGDLKKENKELDKKLEEIQHKFKGLEKKYEKEVSSLIQKELKTHSKKEGVSRVHNNFLNEEKLKQFQSDRSDLKVLKKVDPETRNTIGNHGDQSKRAKIINMSTNDIYKLRGNNINITNSNISAHIHNTSISGITNPKPFKEKEREPDLSKLQNDYHKLFRELQKNKEIALHDETIIDMLSKTPQKGEKNPYRLEFYKKRLDEKNNELGKLKSKLSKLQSHLKIKKSSSKEKLIYTNNFTEKRGNINAPHKRSKSETNKSGTESRQYEKESEKEPPTLENKENNHFEDYDDRRNMSMKSFLKKDTSETGYSGRDKQRYDEQSHLPSNSGTKMQLNSNNHNYYSYRSGSTDNILRDKSQKKSRPQTSSTQNKTGGGSCSGPGTYKHRMPGSVHNIYMCHPANKTVKQMICSMKPHTQQQGHLHHHHIQHSHNLSHSTMNHSHHHPHNVSHTHNVSHNNIHNQSTSIINTKPLSSRRELRYNK